MDTIPQGTIKVASITGWDLSFWVALAESLSPRLAQEICVTKEATPFGLPVYADDRCIGYRYAPHLIWSQGGPLIEKYGISIYPHLDGQGWYAHAHSGRGTRMEGPTPLTAAMRSIVATKYGQAIAHHGYHKSPLSFGQALG